MKIYFDLCAIQRPLDTPNQVRTGLEAEAVLGLITLCDMGQIELIASEALIYEGEQSSLPVRREHTNAVLSKAKSAVQVSEKERSRASQFMVHGIHPLDALHLALAETGQADYFCTCDDQILRKAKQIKDLQVKVVSPIDLVQEIEK